MATLYSVPQNFNTTLNVGGGIDNSQTSGIVLTSVTGLPTDGGILCFDWASPLDTDVAEYIEYTGISGNTLTGVTRGAEGYSAKAHSNGAIVAGVISQAHIKRLKEKLDGTDTTGVTVGKVTVTTSDIDLATGLNIQVNGADPKRGLYVPASGMFAATTSGAASGQLETSSNKVNVKTFDFDTSADEYVCFNIPAPDYWDLSTITAQFHWTADSGSGTVAFALQGLARSNDDALDTAYGTEQVATDTLITAGDEHISPATAAITVGGTPAKGDHLYFRIFRDVSVDTLGVDARLLGVRIKFGINQYDDQ